MSRNNRIFLGLGSLVLLAIGVFSPIIKVLWVETDFWIDGEGDGVLVMILAACALPFLFAQRFQKGLWLPTLAIWGILLYDFENIISEELAEARYGWYFLFAGVALLTLVASRPVPTEETEYTPPSQTWSSG